jgi:hypothetical protein
VTEGRRHRGEDPDRRRRYRLRRAVKVGGALVGLLLIAAACSSNSTSPGVASLGSTTSTAAASAASSAGLPNGQQSYQQLVAYSQCMRTHGLPTFPDPTESAHSISMPNAPDQNSPQYKSANDACKHLLPFGGGPPSAAQTAQITAKLLKYANCMRAHGEPGFPDPTVKTSGGGIQIGFRLSTGVDPNSPQFQEAQKACRSLSPGGP